MYNVPIIRALNTKTFDRLHGNPYIMSQDDMVVL